MFRLTFILLAVIGVTMLVVPQRSGGDQVVAAAPRPVDPLLQAPVRPAGDVFRPASVDALLGVEHREAPAAAVAEAGPTSEQVVSLSGAAAPEAVPARPREFMSVNDEVASRTQRQQERAAAAADATAESVSDSIETALSDATTAMVTGTRVNVRSGPATGFDVVGQVSAGDVAELLSGNENGWVRIRIQGDGVEGYIAARFLDGNGN